MKLGEAGHLLNFDVGAKGPHPLEALAAFVKVKNRPTLQTDTPIHWPPTVKSRLIGKDPGAGKD